MVNWWHPWKRFPCHLRCLNRMQKGETTATRCLYRSLVGFKNSCVCVLKSSLIFRYRQNLRSRSDKRKMLFTYTERKSSLVQEWQRRVPLTFPDKVAVETGITRHLNSLPHPVEITVSKSSILKRTNANCYSIEGD